VNANRVSQGIQKFKKKTIFMHCKDFINFSENVHASRMGLKKVSNIMCNQDLYIYLYICNIHTQLLFVLSLEAKIGATVSFSR